MWTVARQATAKAALGYQRFGLRVNWGQMGVIAPMNIISFNPGHDGSIAYLKGGRLLVSVEAESLSFEGVDELPSILK